MRIYCDHNATSPLRPMARAAALAALDLGGNASSVHAEGRRARGLVERSREAVAAALGVSPGGVTFTSGATEAAGQALTPALVGAGTVLLHGASEHACVLAGGAFPSANRRSIPVDGNGLLDLAALEEALRTVGARAVLAVQAVNNETGVVQDLPTIAALARTHGATLVCDAVQAIGRTRFDWPAVADILFISGHKLGAPAGVGALVRARSDVPNPPALITGGGQERGARSGTENLSGIAGFAAVIAAAAENTEAENARLAALRDRFEAGLIRLVQGVAFFGAGARRVGNTSCFALPGLAAETALIAFDLAGVALSSGSACTSGKVGRSHVLAAMGVSPEAASRALRVSFGWSSSEADVDALLSSSASVLARTTKARAA